MTALSSNLWGLFNSAALGTGAYITYAASQDMTLTPQMSGAALLGAFSTAVVFNAYYALSTNGTLLSFKSNAEKVGVAAMAAIGSYGAATVTAMYAAQKAAETLKLP